MTVPILEVKGISKTFGKVKALDSVDFYLQKGVVHGLLGENGAGKSSLMNVLSGIYIPEQGTIKIQNKKIERLNPELASSLGIGMVHQEFRLIENFTIKDNLSGVEDYKVTINDKWVFSSYNYKNSVLTIPLDGYANLKKGEQK